MNLEEYRKDYLESIKVSASEDFTNVDYAFTESVVNTLIDAEEIDDFTYGYFNAYGSRGKKMTMDGFYYDEYDKSMVILYTDFSNLDETTTLINSDIDKIYSNMRNLVEACEDGYILDNDFEESSAGYELATIIKLKKEEILKYRFYIITDKIISNRVKNLKKEKIGSKIVDLNIWDMGRLFNLYSSSQIKESIDIVFDEEDKLNCINAVNEDIYKAYLAIIPGNVLAKLYIEYGSRLLEGNVRSFLSVKGKINKGIRNTIWNEPQMFFAYNNGIAATASEIEIDEDGKIKRIKDLQIINGGQTTASIANAILQDKKQEQVEKIFVPMKISIVVGEKYNEMIEKISRYANSQNKVDESDFFSNHPYNVRIEEYSRKTFAPPVNGNPYETIWFYERARGQYVQEQMKLTPSEKNKYQAKHPKKQVLKKVDIAKYIMTFMCRPDIVSKGNQYCSKTFADHIIKKWDQSNTVYNEVYYKKLIAYAITFKRTEDLVSAQDWYKEIKSYRANIVEYSIAVIVDRVKKLYPNKSIDYKRIWNEQNIYTELYNQLIKTTYEIYNFITRDDRLTLNVTEWCKKEECWNRASNFGFELLDEFVDTLIDKDVLKQDEQDSKKDRKLENQLNADIEVIQLGQDYWKKVYNWGVEQKALSQFEIDLLKIASSFGDTGKIPSSKQCASILGIRNKLIADGMPKNFD